eukprot:CAMPEP_0119040746 /NCGR_PEP_ID=MMETSP1177-20130426/10741_1 /TAXON_ID=2985 /ORGANISM="Ochromonas sp, Strain CCMP1899" /LENGTH=392 /DNA_ID=CAMNT_0007006067 /DNA_START=122 /DNA_END=1299 /DNA_ORIENTATION=-
MDSLGPSRFPEYQAVLVVELDDGRLFPLTEGCPKCLLPLANRKLLAYQLDLLSKSGVLEIYIAAPREYQTQLSQFLSEYGNSDTASVEFVWVDHMNGSADGLRAVYDRIRGDFICMGSDMLSQYSLKDLSDLHRSRASDVTMLLVSAPTEEAEKKGAPKKVRIDEEDQEYIGVCEDGRVMMKTPIDEIEESIKILKPLLNRCTSSLTVRNDLQDMGVYIMAQWIIDFLIENKKVLSVRTELLPFLVQRQFQSGKYLSEIMPTLKCKTGTGNLSAVDKWLIQSENKNYKGVDPSVPVKKELIDYLFNDISVLKPVSSAEGISTMKKGQGGCVPLEEEKTVDGNCDSDLLRCFAVIYERKGSKGAHGTQQSYKELDPPPSDSKDDYLAVLHGSK